jgi:hypothetical protein
MHTAVKNAKTNKSTDWSLKPRIEVQKEKVYSADELIDAYFKGRKDQFEEDKKILLETFSKNLEQAKNVCEEFFETLADKEVQCKFVSLRALTITHFDAVFVVAKEKFVSLDFDKIYRRAREKKCEVNTKTFQISFSFMPHTDSLNEGRMLTDGYIMRYGKAA